MRRLLAGGLLVLALAACSDDGSSADTDTPETAPSPTGSTTTEPAGPTYVALGDSYTAAPLITDDAATDGCLRSPANYPALVAAELGYTLNDVSCAGATTDNLRTAQGTSTGEAPPQLDAVTADAELVTIGMGGNDGAVFSRLIGCATTGASAPACGGPLEAAIDEVGGHLTAAVAAIAERAPEAQVVVVGYPQIIAPDADCPDLLPVAAADAPALAALNERLHTVQQAAAEAAGVTYVDLYDASAGHDVCSDDPWVNGVQTTPGVGLALHPLAVGQRETADLVLAALEG